MTVVVGREEEADGQALAFGTIQPPDWDTDPPDGDADPAHRRPVAMDCDRAHAVVVAGSRDCAVADTLAVIAEGLAAAGGVAPVVVDPTGVFATLASGEAVPATHVDDPTVAVAALPPAAWCSLLGLDPAAPDGALVWRAARAADSLDAMREHVADATASATARRVVENHLATAADWGVFDPPGLDATDCLGGEVTVLDCSGLAGRPTAAVVRAVADGLYAARIADDTRRLPWLLLPGSHAVVGDAEGSGVAAPALRTLLTRGRRAGVGLVLGTRRPSALPSAALAESDLVIAHDLEPWTDRWSVAATRPSFLGDRVAVGAAARDPRVATVVDDASAIAREVRIREPTTPRDDAIPRAAAVVREGED